MINQKLNFFEYYICIDLAKFRKKNLQKRYV